MPRYLLAFPHQLAIPIFALHFLLYFQTAHAAGQDGKTIYQDQCADCHGEKGEGVEGAYEQKLRGILTLYELENYISKTMPEGDETACLGEDAGAVAKYIYDQFYSIDAQNRLDPPKYVFSRLTNEQFRNSVADILATSLNRRESRPRKYGLRGIYYNSRSPRRNKQVNDRIDEKIDFDFGEGSPEKVEGKEFAIRWSGSLIAEETGEYEIIVESANSVRLRLNSVGSPLVDANVVSGDRAEYKARTHLLQGRLYNLVIDVSRFKEKHGFVRISWVRPNGQREVIPPTNYCTDRVGPLPIMKTRLPPDDESYGYARGISISKEWSDAISKAAIEAGQVVVQYFDVFVKPNSDAQKRKQAAIRFCKQFAELAFRKPLSPQLERLYVTNHFETPKLNLRESTKRSIVLILKSPRFLYLDLATNKEDQSNKKDASAYMLARVYWDSVPNKELLDAQRNNSLKDKPSINRLLDRALDDKRARIKLENFFVHYLKLNGLHNLEKDAELFKGFDHALAEDLKRSLRLQVNDLVWNRNGGLKELFSTQTIFANDRVREFYGLEAAEDAPSIGGFSESKFPGGNGVLTHPLIMSGFAYNKSSSPIHRGVFVAKSIIGRRLNPPPDTFPPFDGEIAKTWTTREKVAFQTKPDNCQRCHGLINNLGFAFEEFDAVGKTRAKDNQKPVDTKGQYRTDAGKLIQYSNAAELANFLAESDSVHENFVNELFQFLVKQPLSVYGEEASDRLIKHFRDSKLNIKSLMREIGKVAAFYPPNR